MKKWVILSLCMGVSSVYGAEQIDSLSAAETECASFNDLVVSASDPSLRSEEKPTLEEIVSAWTECGRAHLDECVEVNLLEITKPAGIIRTTTSPVESETCEHVRKMKSDAEYELYNSARTNADALVERIGKDLVRQNYSFTALKNARSAISSFKEGALYRSLAVRKDGITSIQAQAEYHRMANRVRGFSDFLRSIEVGSPRVSRMN